MLILRPLGASALVVIALLCGAPPAAVARFPVTTSAPADDWRWPVAQPQVVQIFNAPQTRYSAGHRGIDLLAKAEEAVLAPHDGVVSFTGRVVDRPVLSISQPGDLISTVEPVVALVAEGDRVRAGQVIGTVSSGGHCASGCLHWGVRLHGRYVSPLLYFGLIHRAVLLPSTAGRVGAQARGWASP